MVERERAEAGETNDGLLDQTVAVSAQFTTAVKFKWNRKRSMIRQWGHAPAPPARPLLADMLSTDAISGHSSRDSVRLLESATLDV